MRRVALVLLSAVPLALAAALPAGATSPIDQKKAEAEQVWNQIQDLNQSLGKYDELIKLANDRLATLRANQLVNAHELDVARHNLARSRTMIAKRLLALYNEPQTSTLDMILGATSVSDLLDRIDSTNRLSAVDRHVLGDVITFRRAVIQHARELRHAKAYEDKVLAQRKAEYAAISSHIAERNRLLQSIKDQISTLEAQERAREAQLQREAQARVAAAQAAHLASLQSTVVGASAAPPPDASSGGVIPSSPYGSQVIQIAMSYIGTPYVWGGAAPGGFDCSGLVMYSFAQLGVSLPHLTYSQWNYGVAVPYSELQPGDLVFFDGLGHVGLYIGGGEFVDAPYTGAYVRVDSMTSGWALSHYSGARRIL